MVNRPQWVNTLRPRENGRHFADDIFKCIFFNENAWISLRISLKFVPKVRINNILALVQKMAWRRPGDKPLSEPVMVSLLTHICVTRPQWVNYVFANHHRTSECWKPSLCDKWICWLQVGWNFNSLYPGVFCMFNSLRLSDIYMLSVN